MTNPMTMVERVAEAMWKAYHESEGHRTASDGISWQTIRESVPTNEGARIYYAMGIAEARAAIAAMRLPSDEDFGGKYGTEPRRLFSEMIDTALSEHQTQTRKG
jgi:hypothetical protein